MEKIKTVIAYIDENFTSNISREGLAAVIDMHPNYMGSQFKKYTGQSLSRYINQLRIDEAIRQLESGNSTVFNIAYSVGYKNIVTFNRIFKDITGKTPSEHK